MSAERQESKIDPKQQLMDATIARLREKAQRTPLAQIWDLQHDIVMELGMLQRQAPEPLVRKIFYALCREVVIDDGIIEKGFENLKKFALEKLKGENKHWIMEGHNVSGEITTIAPWLDFDKHRDITDRVYRKLRNEIRNTP